MVVDRQDSLIHWMARAPAVKQSNAEGATADQKAAAPMTMTHSPTKGDFIKGRAAMRFWPCSRIGSL